MILRRTAIVWFLILVSCGGLRATAVELVDPTKLDALVRSAVDSGWIQGAAIGLINEQGTQTAGYGHSMGADSAAPDADTVFELGSITKVFTGLALAQMVEQDTIALEDPVQQLVGDSIKVPKGKERDITLVDLSTHSSGLPRMPDNFNPKDPSDPFADYTLEQLTEFLAKHKLRRQPGVRSEYSNVGVGLLGHALAVKAGMPYEDLVRQHICEPLDMTDTRITLDDDLRSRMAQGHDFDGNPAPPWSLPTLAGAGALRSTVNDMLKFLSANMGLSKTPFDGALAASHVKHFDLPGGGGIALGWHIQGDGVIWHNGGTGGYHTFTGYSPERKAGVVVLANTSVMAVDQLGRRLLQLLITGDAKPLKLPQPIRLDTDALDRFAGDYKSPPIPTITVAREGDGLTLHIAGQPNFRLYPKSDAQFFTRASADVNVSFESDEDGGVKQLVIHQGGQDVPVARVKDAKPQE